jgi:hypothetical protein
MVTLCDMLARRGTPRTAATSATQPTLAPAAWRYCLPTGDLANEMFAFADAEPLRRFPRGEGFWLPMSRRSPAKGP